MLSQHAGMERQVADLGDPVAFCLSLTVPIQPLYLSVYISTYLFIFIYLSSNHCIYLYAVSVYIVYLRYIYLSIVWLCTVTIYNIYLSVHPSIQQSIALLIYQSINLYKKNIYTLK